MEANSDRIAYGVDEAARLVGISRDGLFRAIAAGEIRSAKVGGRRLIRRDVLLAWVERHEQEAVTA